MTKPKPLKNKELFGYDLYKGFKTNDVKSAVEWLKREMLIYFTKADEIIYIDNIINKAFEDVVND